MAPEILFNIGLGNGLTLVRCQAITCPSAELLSHELYWNLKLPATWLSVQQLVWATNKVNTKPLYYWTFVRRNYQWQWITLTKGQWCAKCFHIMTSALHFYNFCSYRAWKMCSISYLPHAWNLFVMIYTEQCIILDGNLPVKKRLA